MLSQSFDRIHHHYRHHHHKTDETIFVCISILTITIPISSNDDYIRYKFNVKIKNLLQIGNKILRKSIVTHQSDFAKRAMRMLLNMNLKTFKRSWLFSATNLENLICIVDNIQLNAWRFRLDNTHSFGCGLKLKSMHTNWVCVGGAHEIREADNEI